MKNRQLELLIYLLKYKRTTYRELAVKFEVSTKTIERDIDRLAKTGVPVYCQQGSGGGVIIDENYKFSTSFFTPQDIGHMVTALHMAQAFTANPRNKEVLQKLALVAPNLTTLYEENVQTYFYIDNPVGPVDFATGIYEKINNCIDFRNYVTIDGIQKNICLGYVFKDNHIYLFVFQDGYKLIDINKIKQFDITQETSLEEYMSYKTYISISN